jgi:hypothetical protein
LVFLRSEFLTFEVIFFPRNPALYSTVTIFHHHAMVERLKRKKRGVLCLPNLRSLKDATL